MSSMIPILMPEFQIDTVAERAAQAAREREVLETMGDRSAMNWMRLQIGNMFVRVGERMIPSHPRAAESATSAAAAR